MKQHVDFFRTKIPKGRGVSRNALLDAVFAQCGDPFRAKAVAAFADPET